MSKTIYYYGLENVNAPLIILNTFDGDGKAIVENMKKITSKKFTMAVISGVNWNDELSPWPFQEVLKNGGEFTGGADKYIKEFTTNLYPQILKNLSAAPAFVAIAGYSLAGLFALYSTFKTDIFSKVISVSSSFWFPGFLDFVKNNSINPSVDTIYFSLGAKESKTRNQIMKNVMDNTKEIYNIVKTNGIKTIFEINEGNHFTNPDLRIAKGIAYCLEN